MERNYRVDAGKLRSEREGAGLTVAGLAERAGIHAYQLMLVEGQGYVPTLTVLRSITQALDIPAHTVIEWKTARPLREEVGEVSS